MSKDPGRTDNPPIATDGSGNLSMVWLDKASGRFQVFFAQSTNSGVLFSPALRLSTTQSSVGTAPNIAVDSPGGLYAVWSERPDNTIDKSVIMFSRSLNGGEILHSRSLDSGDIFSESAAIGGTDGLTSRR